MDLVATHIKWRRIIVRAKLVNSLVCVSANDIASSLQCPDILIALDDRRGRFEDHDNGTVWMTSAWIAEILSRIFVHLDKMELMSEFDDLLTDILPDLANDAEHNNTKDSFNFVKYHL